MAKRIAYNLTKNTCHFNVPKAKQKHNKKLTAKEEILFWHAFIVNFKLNRTNE